MPETPTHLADLLGPDLPDARCRGKAPHFDAHVPGETPKQRKRRLTAAHETCTLCPARTACSDAIRNTPNSRRNGIWAGTTYGRS